MEHELYAIAAQEKIVDTSFASTKWALSFRPPEHGSERPQPWQTHISHHPFGGTATEANKTTTTAECHARQWNLTYLRSSAHVDRPRRRVFMRPLAPPPVSSTSPKHCVRENSIGSKQSKQMEHHTKRSRLGPAARQQQGRRSNVERAGAFSALSGLAWRNSSRSTSLGGPSKIEKVDTAAWPRSRHHCRQQHSAIIQSTANVARGTTERAANESTGKAQNMKKMNNKKYNSKLTPPSSLIFDSIFSETLCFSMSR